MARLWIGNIEDKTTDEELQGRGIELCFAEMKDPVKDKLKRFGLFERFGAATASSTVGWKVAAYQAQVSEKRPSDESGAPIMG